MCCSKTRRMITVIGLPYIFQMPADDHELCAPAASESDMVEYVRGVLDSREDAAEALTALREGESIADILLPLGLPVALTAAVKLYPLARDGFLADKSLQRRLDPALSKLIDGLTQLGRFELAENWSPGEALATEQSEVLRKMLLSVVSDARLVVARIAEQLYRLRAAKKSPLAAQRRIAIETQEIYAPLANRLGIWQLKWELEDLAFRFLQPEQYKEIANALNEKRVEREKFIAGVKSMLHEHLWNHSINAEISGRPKHIFSIWRKMQSNDRQIEQIFDVRAVRILVNTVAECYAALGAAHNIWAYLPGEFDDYIANPKDNGYQSLHTALIGPEGKTLEVQIRTHEMHRDAELGVAAHWRYKEGGSAKAQFDQKIRRLRQLLEPTDHDGDLFDQIRGDAFEDRIYAVSPKGDVVELPSGATPLDFAYHVHTNVGHRCKGAKVNGRIVPLTYQLKNGDKVDIIVGKQEQPSRDWLSPQLAYLKATRSRTKVRSWFRLRDKEQNKRQGKDIFERELTRLNVRNMSATALAKQLKFRDTSALFVALGAGDLSSAAVASAVQHLRDDSDEIVPRRRGAKKKQSPQGGVAISGVGDLMYNIARCCRPVPPESISGYITLGRGVSIHREDCGNLLSLRQRNPDRVIEVSWGGEPGATYPAALSVYAFDRHGLLRDISTVLADEKIGVAGVNTETDRQTMQAEMRLTITVPGLEALSRAMQKLEQLPNVTAVRRHN